jgi:hypothetical protein
MNRQLITMVLSTTNPYTPSTAGGDGIEMDTDAMPPGRSRSSAGFENGSFMKATSSAADGIRSFSVEMATEIIVSFLHCANCSESRLFMMDSSRTPSSSSATEIFYTNFVWNNVSTGVICSRRGEYPVRQCIFVGKSPSKEFYGGLPSRPFAVSGCFFDDVPARPDAWTDESNNHLIVTTSSHVISVIGCLSASRSPLATPRRTSCRSPTATDGPRPSRSLSPPESQSPYPTESAHPIPTGSEAPLVNASGSPRPTESNTASPAESCTPRATDSEGHSPSGSDVPSPTPPIEIQTLTEASLLTEIGAPTDSGTRTDVPSLIEPPILTGTTESDPPGSDRPSPEENLSPSELQNPTGTSTSSESQSPDGPHSTPVDGRPHPHCRRGCCHCCRGDIVRACEAVPYKGAE